MNNKKLQLLAAAAAFSLLATQGAFAQKKYDTGASDTEIKIGNVEAYSGPASAYGIIGKTEEAYFKMVNDQGGINGRKINWISYDDGYSPPKTVEQMLQPTWYRRRYQSRCPSVAARLRRLATDDQGRCTVPGRQARTSR